MRQPTLQAEGTQKTELQWTAASEQGSMGMQA